MLAKNIVPHKKHRKRSSDKSQQETIPTNIPAYKSGEICSDSASCPKHQSKSSNKTKSKGKNRQSRPQNKQAKADQSRRTMQMSMKRLNLVDRTVRKQAASQDPEGKHRKQFRRTNNRTQKISNNKKDSKRSTDNQNEETLVQRLKAENQYYRRAYLTSKESLQKIAHNLQQQKRQRSSQKQWFKHQIDNLKRKINGEKIQLGHIFSYQAFNIKEVSNMIIQVDNESSSLCTPLPKNMLSPEDINDAFSDLSIQSK